MILNACLLYTSVEELVLEIRGKYDKITNGIASNSYDAVIVDDGVMAYAGKRIGLHIAGLILFLI